MQEQKKRKGFKEFFRKFIVSLKKRPMNIPLVFALIVYIFYSLNLTTISNTTAVINKQPMGLCCFITMLFSILGLVSFLNAYPKRQKPKTFMIVVFYVIEVILIVCDLAYIIKINEGIPSANLDKNPFIITCRTIVLVHLILEVVLVALAVAFPFIGKLLNKIDTSIQIDESTVKEIDVESDE